MKGKSAIHIARFGAVAQLCRAALLGVSTLGRDERAIRAYIRVRNRKTDGKSRIGSETATQVAATVAILPL